MTIIECNATYFSECKRCNAKGKYCEIADRVIKLLLRKQKMENFIGVGSFIDCWDLPLQALKNLEIDIDTVTPLCEVKGIKDV